ncbi:MAG: biotin/lipoyl-containing protein [bacterium]
MAYDVIMPDLGEGSGEEATVSYWFVEEGDIVERDDDLVELQTDKAVFSLPAPIGGEVLQILAHEGDVVEVGDILCIIEPGH